MTRVDQAGLSQPPNTFFPPRTAVAVLRGIQRGPRNGMNGCLLDLFGQKLSWRARSESRLRRQIGRCQHFLSLAGYTVTFCSISFCSYSGGAVKSIPTPKGTVAVSEKRPSNSRKLHAAESDIEDKPSQPSTGRPLPTPPRQLRYGSFPPRKRGNPWPPCIGTGDQGRKTLNSARRSGSTI